MSISNKIDLQRDFAAGVYLSEAQNPIPLPFPPHTLYTLIEYINSCYYLRGNKHIYFYLFYLESRNLPNNFRIPHSGLACIYAFTIYVLKKTNSFKGKAFCQNLWSTWIHFFLRVLL
jgi:hypothetical protein